MLSLFHNSKTRTTFAVALAMVFACGFLYSRLSGKRNSQEVSGNPRVARHESAKHESKPETLEGEEANERIKNDPKYKSLQEAMQESFYRVEKDATVGKDAYYANNHGQAMSVSFEKGETVLRVKQAKPEDPNQKEVNRKDSIGKLKQGGEREAQSVKQIQSEALTMRFMAAGYGNDWQTVSGESEMMSDKNRLTYKHKVGDESSLIEEWYVNKASGIEHGFTLSKPLAGREGKDQEKLRLQMSLHSAGRFKVRVGGDGKGLILTDPQGRELSYGGLKVFDSVGQELESRMSYSRGSVTIECSDAGANYPVTIDPVWSQVQKLTASDAAVDNQFGVSVSISGDTAIVGALFNDSSGGSDQGSAYIFERNQGGDNNWGAVKQLFASDAAAFDRFGISVSISGDTAIVGAYFDDDARGSAYIFERNQGGANNWGEVKRIFGSDAAAGDFFGFSVSISGDTAIVGAYLHTNFFMLEPVAILDRTSGSGLSSEGEGSAYIFERNQGGANNWGEVDNIFGSFPGANDAFGYSVSISGDTAIVGAYRDDDRERLDQGSAYIFKRTPGGPNRWREVKRILASDAAANDLFGSSVSISGDTAIVGAYFDDGARGSAYIFERNHGGDNNWGEVKLASDAALGDRFGISVSISGDTAIVGAELDAGSAGSFQGSAYIFERNQGGDNNWGQVQHLFASDAAANDDFGNSVSISGDTAIVGAHFDGVHFDGVSDVGGGAQGSAYIFERNQGGDNKWGEVKHLFASDAAAGDEFGFSVSISGDTAIVGAYHADGSAGLNQGSAYIFERNQGGDNNWGAVKQLFASDAAATARFGFSVSISGDTAIVGAYSDDGSAGSEQGSAYIFERNQGGANNWGEVKQLFASDAAAFDQFGNSVSISRDTAIVGALFDAGSGGSDQGSAYIFERNQGGDNTWGEVKHLFASDAAFDDRFGFSVSISGDTAIVGAYLDDGSGGSDQGSAYIFKRNQGGDNNWGAVKHLFASDAAAVDFFGISVSISGDTAIVGALRSGGSEQGSAYIFERNQGGDNNWGQVKHLFASDAAAVDRFGSSVSISGDTAIVGDTGGSGQASAYIFGRNQGGANNWGEVKHIFASDAAANDLFGSSVSISGDTAIVGAPFDDGFRGSAYIFVNAPPNPDVLLSDDFNDNIRDVGKWKLGVVNRPSGAFDPLAQVQEVNQQLEITPRALLGGLHFNGYVSVLSWNLTNARAAVEVVQATNPTDYAETVFCIGIDDGYWYRMMEEHGQLYFQFRNGAAISSTNIPYNAVSHRFWRFGHNPVGNQLLYQTSSDGSTWVTQRTVAVGVPLTALKIELSAGTYNFVSPTGTAIFDNFVLESNSAPPLDDPPAVASTTPGNGATNQAADTNVVVNFSEPVNVTGNWFQIACPTSGTRNVSDTAVTGGPVTFTINPNTDFAPGETCTVTVNASQVSDQDANDPPDQMAANYVFSFTASLLADDFDDNSRDTSKWKLGVVNRPGVAFDPLVQVQEVNQQLEITPRALIGGLHFNGYVSVVSWDLTNARAAVEVVQSTNPTDYAETVFCIGIDDGYWYRMMEEHGQLYFQFRNGGAISSANIPYNAVSHRFWRFGHNPVGNQLLYQTSSDGSTWVTQRTVAVGVPLTALKIELSAGTYNFVSPTGKAIFDNFVLETPGL